MEQFNKENEVETVENEMCYVTLYLNMPLMPTNRIKFFEDPIDELLQKNNIGECTGGGTFLLDGKMPKSCEIEFAIKKNQIDRFITFLKKDDAIGKGSYVEYNGKKEEIGCLEGLGLILDATGLDDSVYEENDINVVIGDIIDLIKGKGEYYSYYIDEENANFYFYGKSFTEMEEIIANYTKTSSLCQNCKIKQI